MATKNQPKQIWQICLISFGILQFNGMSEIYTIPKFFEWNNGLGTTGSELLWSSTIEEIEFPLMQQTSESLAIVLRFIL